MNPILQVIFYGCLQATIPNPHTIGSLIPEQRDVIYQYAQTKCNREVKAYIDFVKAPELDCGPDDRCM